MLRHAKTWAPSLAIAALLLGLVAPAFADVPPAPRERKTRTVEPQKAPPMTPPLEEPVPPPEVEPAPQPAPEPVVAPAPEPAVAPTPKPEAKEVAKAATVSKTSSCSIDAGSEQALAGIAALVMLIAGAALRGRGRAD